MYDEEFCYTAGMNQVMKPHPRGTMLMLSRLYRSNLARWLALTGRRGGQR